MLQESTYHIFIITFISIVFHGQILMNDNWLDWDDGFINSWQRHKKWKNMKRFFSEAGMPFLYYQHRLMSYFPHRNLTYRLLTVISITVSAISVYIIAANFKLLSPSNALMLSMLYVSYTGAHMVVTRAVGLQYTFSTCLFYSAILLSMISDGYSSYEHSLLRILAFVLFIVSFHNMNSLLVFYFGYLLLRAIIFFSQTELAFIQVINFVASNIDYISLPFVFWVVKEKFTPRHGYFEDYNRLRLNPSETFMGFITLVTLGFEGSITGPLLSLLKKRLLWFPVLSVFLISLVCPNMIQVIEPLANDGYVLLFGIALLVLAGLPYIAVGQTFGLWGWVTRNSSLLHLPVALILLGALHWVIPLHMIMHVTLLLVISFGLYLNIQYLNYLSVYVKNRSWLFHLFNQPASCDISIFQVVDNHSIQQPIPHLAYLFEWLWGDLSRFGISEPNPRHVPYSSEEIRIAIRNTRLDYDFEAVDVTGAQATIIIKSGTIRMPEIIALEYIMRNLFSKRSLPDFFSKVTTIEFEKFSNSR